MTKWRAAVGHPVTDSGEPRRGAGAPPTRRGYIDWFRGLAILVMVEAHVLDAWTRSADRASALFGWATILGGFAAPAFLFLAGIGTVLAVGAKRRRLGSEAAAAAAVRRRGWEIFGLAFVFRAQAIVLNPGAPLAGLLKVDILNIMGPAMALSGTVLGSARRLRTRLAILAMLTAAFTFLAPTVRTSGWVAWLPDPLERYVRPRPGSGTFTLFPWAGFLFAGTFIGVLLDRHRSDAHDRRLHAALIIAGGAVALAAYGASYLPAAYSTANFWTTSPTFFFLRAGILTALLGGARFWGERRRLTPVGRFGPLERFGRESMFVYWIHVELVYGWFSSPLHRALSLAEVTAAFAAFSAALFVLVLLKERWLPRGRVTAAFRARLR